MILQGFRPVHYVAYSIFFLGKIMFVASVGALYSGSADPIPFGVVYAVLVFISFVIGMYDQWKTEGLGFDQLEIDLDPLHPIHEHKYELSLKPVMREEY